MRKKWNHSAAFRPERRLFFLRLGLLTGGALVLRLIFSAEMACLNGGFNSVFAPSSATDMATYLRLADEILSGTFRPPFYYQPFYYGVFLPAVRFVSSSPWLLMAMQSLLGAAACGLAGLTAAGIWSRRAGLWTAGFCAVSVPLILYTPFAMNETLQSFLFALLAYGTVRCLDSGQGKMKFAVLCGMVWGCSCLTRGNAILFAPLFLVLFCRKGFRTRGLVIFGIAVLVQLPMAAVNSAKTGRLCGPSTAADAVLALGNTPEAPPGGRNPGLPAGPMEYPETYRDFMARTPGESVPHQIFRWMLREPGAFWELQFRKALLFWTGDEIPNNVSLYGEGRFSRILAWDVPGRSGILLALALAGMFGCWKRICKKRWMVLYGMVILYWGATAIFYNLSRFRAPVVPLALVFAGCFADRAVRMFRCKRPLLAEAVLPLALGVFIVNGAYPFYGDYCEAGLQKLFRPEGIVYRGVNADVLKLDHGPFSFGGWETADVRPGTVLEKIFAGMPGRREAEIQWSFALSDGEAVSGKLAGVPFEASASSPCVSVRAPVQDGKVILEIEQCSPGAAGLLDTRRRYGRSRADGSVLNGEFIARIHYKEKEK